MPRRLSDVMRQALAAQNSRDALLILADIALEDGETLRVVSNHTPLMHQGHEYSPLAFDLVLPLEEENGSAAMQWRIDNVDQRLIEVFRGAKDKIKTSIRFVFASLPDDVQIGPIKSEMYEIDYTPTQISGALTIKPILEKNMGHKRMSPSNAPGLF